MPDSTVTDVKPTTANARTDTPQKDGWTLMFLIMGDASLSASMISQLKELTDAGFQRDTNVLLYFDPNCNGKGARIYDVNHKRKQDSLRKDKTFVGDGANPFVRNIAEDCNIQSLQQIPAALSLSYFLTYSRTYYPANNYMLFLMGHGVIVGNDEFLPDTDDNSSITLASLGVILKDFGRKVRATEGDEFHLVGFHSCGMSSVELAFELQGSARYMMGTQGSAFPGSWPYRQLLKKIFNLVGDPQYDQARNTNDEYPNELVKEILKGLQNLSFYNALDFSDAGFSADLSICNLDPDQVEKLKQALRVLVGELKEGLKNGAEDSILLAHWESQSYFGESYTDLYDFCECLQNHCPKDGSQNGISQACEQVRKVLESERCEKSFKTDPDGSFHQPVVFSDYYGPAYQHSNGLSIFFPWKAPIRKVMRSYESYAFTKELGSDSWMTFLKDYFFKTRRPLRNEEEPRKELPEEIAIQPLPLEIPSDAQILRLGPPPRQKPYAVAERIATLQQDIGTLAAKMAKMKETGSLPEKIAKLERETGSLAKEMGSLAASGEKETGTLAKEMGSLADKLVALEKETGSLAGANKETGSLAKEMGSLAKEMGSLAKETGTLSKETGSLAKETGSLAKEMASLGLFGSAIIKNFDAPDDERISSRPNGEPNQGRKQSFTDPERNRNAGAATTSGRS